MAKSSQTDKKLEKNLGSNSEVPKHNTIMPPPQTIVNENAQMTGQRTGITESVSEVLGHGTRGRNISSDQISETDNRDVSHQIREVSCLRSNSEVPKPNPEMPPPLTVVNQNTQMAGKRTGITENAPDVSERSTLRINISSDQIPETEYGDFHIQIEESLRSLRNISPVSKPNTVISSPQTIVNENTQMAAQHTGNTESISELLGHDTHRRNISSDQSPETEYGDFHTQITNRLYFLLNTSPVSTPNTVMSPPLTIVNQNTQMAEQRTGITESAPHVSRRRTHKRNISSDEIPKTDNRGVSRQIREVSCLFSFCLQILIPVLKKYIGFCEQTFGTGHPNTMTFQVEHSTPTSIKLRRTIGGTSDLKCSTVEYPTISAPRTSPPLEKPKTKGNVQINVHNIQCGSFGSKTPS